VRAYSWTLFSEPIIERDAVELSQQELNDGFSADQINVARFIVRRR
jgi:hypothetical protein